MTAVTFKAVEIWMVGMISFTERSQMLISVIKAYENDNSSPPETLSRLVPMYLDAVPSTGMMAHPNYRYISGNEAKERYFDNSWVLSVFMPIQL